MRYLKVSTVVTLKLGPFLDEDDGKTAEAGLAIAQADVRLSKNGGAFAQKNDVNAAAHDENGWYGVQINATDTNTLGRLIIAIHEGGALPVWADCTVVTANVWDSLCGADKLEVDLLQMGGVAQSATDLKDFADAGYNPATDKVTGVLLVDGVTTVTGNVGGNVVGTVGSVVGAVGSVAGNVGGNVVGTVASIVGNLGGDVVGDVQGDVLGNVIGTVASVVGNVGGNIVGTVASVVGSVGSVVGNVGGNVVGTVASIVGNLGGDVVGDIQGDVLGNVIGTVASVIGNVGGNVVGTVASVVGSVASVVGDVGGNIVGNVQGTVASVVGNLGGNVQGNVVGSVGSVLGNVVGSVGSVVGNVGGSVASMLVAGRNQVADSVLSRAITNTEAAAPFRSLTGAIAKLVNRVGIVGANLVIFETDDVTAYGQQAVTEDALANPIVDLDTA